MVKLATAVEFIPIPTTGRTRPLVLRCNTDEDDPVELFCKISARCDQSTANLVREVIAAALARDLGLPVPDAFLVEIPRDVARSIPDQQITSDIERSSPIAFGSVRVPNQFSVWKQKSRITRKFREMALAVFVFDVLIYNVDRKTDNPNCLTKGNQIYLIDHELAFTHNLALNSQSPWVFGGLQPERDILREHIFFRHLEGKGSDFSSIINSWEVLSDENVRAYKHAIPAEWSAASNDVRDALDRIRGVCDHIDGCIEEIRRVLNDD